MGHLINPMAFRVGWSHQWVDDFFVELRFYPELLHRLLRFRYFLNCFFHASKYKSNYFDEHLVSHFRFRLDLRGFSLLVYFYNSRVDATWYDFFDGLSDKPFGRRFFPRPEDGVPPFSSWNRKFLSLLGILYIYAVSNEKDELKDYRLPFYKSFEDNLQPVEFLHAYQLERLEDLEALSLNEQQCLLLLSMLRVATMQEVGQLKRAYRGFGLKLVNYEMVAQNFFRWIYMFHVTKPFLLSFAAWLRFLGTSFFLKQPLNVFFLQVSNDQLSARFIARFLAIRFSQGVPVRAAVNPIRRDLRLAKKFARRLHLKKRAFALQEESSPDGSHSLFFNFFSYSTLFAQRTALLYRSFWTFDQFFLAFHFFSLNQVCFLKRYYQSLRLFFEKRLLFNIINRFSSEARKLFFLMEHPVAFLLELRGVYHFNYESSRSFLSLDSFFSLRGVSPASLLFLTGGALFDFLKFSANHPVNTRKLDTRFPIKRRSFRSFKVPALGLHGFRIRLHGRFTRKQIASSFHFQEGAMPLSTLKATIDYGFATVPLRNSAVGVKVWLYRKGFVAGHDFIF